MDQCQNYVEEWTAQKWHRVCLIYATLNNSFHPLFNSGTNYIIIFKLVISPEWFIKLWPKQEARLFPNSDEDKPIYCSKKHIVKKCSNPIGSSPVRVNRVNNSCTGHIFISWKWWRFNFISIKSYFIPYKNLKRYFQFQAPMIAGFQLLHYINLHILEIIAIFSGNSILP